jgi:hypothetical protein
MHLMMKKSVFALCCVALLAAPFALPASAQVQVAKTDGKVTHIAAARQVPPPCIGLGCTLFSNFGPPFARWLIGPGTGWPILGATAPGGPVYIAVPFTPAQNSHVTNVIVPVQCTVCTPGTKGFEISIQPDCAGVPCGVALVIKQEVANTPFPACCIPADRINAIIAPSLGIVAGTQYWVVVDTLPAADTLTQDTWAWSPLGTGFAYDVGAGWVFQPLPPSPAAKVIGSIP